MHTNVNWTLVQTKSDSEDYFTSHSFTSENMMA